jgi:hypothetical protein
MAAEGFVRIELTVEPSAVCGIATKLKDLEALVSVAMPLLAFRDSTVLTDYL